MKYLNYNDKMYSKIGIGTGRFGTVVPRELSWELLDIFVQNGGTVIDTARNYYEWVENGRGKSEECIGEWMSNRHNRDRVCICTKGGVRNNGNEWHIDLSKGALLAEIQQSLEALRTDYIDIYVLHRDEPSRDVREIVDTLQHLAELANITHIGVSNWKADRVIAANEYAAQNSLRPLEIVQTWWSLAEYKYEMWDDENTTHMDYKLYEYMLENSMTGMAYTSMCKGFFQKACEVGLENVDEFLKYRIATERNLKKLDFIKRYCKENKVSPTAFVTGYITSNALSGIALVSTSQKNHLNDIIDSSDYELPTEIINKIDSI